FIQALTSVLHSAPRRRQHSNSGFLKAPRSAESTPACPETALELALGQPPLANQPTENRYELRVAVIILRVELAPSLMQEMLNGPHVLRRLRGRRTRLEVLQDLSQLGLQSHLERPPRQLLLRLGPAQFAHHFAHRALLCRRKALIPQRFDSAGCADSFLAECEHVLGLRVRAARFN